MTTKRRGYLVMEVGIVIFIVSLAADWLGIGNQVGFGWKQGLGMAAGVIIAAVGLWLVRRNTT